MLSATQMNRMSQKGHFKYLLIILFLLTILFLVLAWKSATKNSYNSINYQMQEAQDMAQSRLDNYLSGLDNLLTNTAENSKLTEALTHGDRHAAKEILQDTLKHKYGEYLDLLLLTRKEQYWTNLNSPLYLLGDNINSIIMDIPYFTKWSSIELTSTPASLITLIQRYPILSNESGMVTGSLLGGIILNDNLTLLNLLGKDTKDKSLTLLLEGSPVGPTFSDIDIAVSVFDRIIASNLAKGKIEKHFFTRQYLLINGEKSKLQLLLISDTNISKPVTDANLYHQLLALALLFFAIVAWLMVRNKNNHY